MRNFDPLALAGRCLTLAAVLSERAARREEALRERIRREAEQRPEE